MTQGWEPSDSMMVDVGTPGIDRGEDDYIPTDEYDPSEECCDEDED